MRWAGRAVSAKVQGGLRRFGLMPLLDSPAESTLSSSSTRRIGTGRVTSALDISVDC